MKDIKVKKIKEGTVIDHITGGQALNVLKILGISKEYPRITVTVAMNVFSSKMGTKDIVKIEGRELKADEVDKIALIANDANINIIRNYKVVEKKRVSVPDVVEGVVSCGNKNCITHFEDIQPKFIVRRKNPIKLRCAYCDRVMAEREIVRQF